MSLSPRLQSLYNYCLHDQPLWDLCCDHGLLGLWAVEHGAHPWVAFNDRVESVVRALEPKVQFFGDRVRLYPCAAEDIADPIVGNVVIAGVGGERTALILRQLHKRGLLQAQRLVLCPEKDADWLRTQTFDNYRLVVEQQIPHNHSFRWQLVFDRT